MDELTSSNIQVVLRIKEGKGFDQILHSTSLTASLNGHLLETNAIEASANPQYTTDLIWELDKITLRKLRSGQVTLKLECFAFKEDDTKDKVGYALLSIRSAQIVPRNKSTNVKYTWHKLLGLKSDIKPPKPELFLALCVEEQEIKPNLTIEPSQTPALAQNEHIIQLGSINTSLDLFLLSITACFLENIDFLLPAKYFINERRNLTLCYTIFNSDVSVKLIEQNHEKNLLCSEKVILKIKSSLDELKNYLDQNPFLFLSLHYQNNLISRSQVDLRSLISDENIGGFHNSSPNICTIIEQKCTLTRESPDTLLFDTNKPYIDLVIKLTHAGMNLNPMEQQNLTESVHSESYSVCNEDPFSLYNNPNFSLNSKLPELESHRNPYGDCGQNISLCNSNCLMKYNTHNSDLRSHEALKICNSTSYHMLQKQEHLCACVESPKSAEAYHCYCLHIKLNAMTLLSTNLKIKDINFRFHHPKAQIMSTLYQKLPISSGEKVKFQDVGCKLQFISVVNEIKNLLLAFPPKLTIHDAGSIENIIFSECILDVVRLFHQSKLECQYEAPLFDANKKHIGKFDIMLHLEDQGPYYKAGRKAHAENFGPPILDDSLAYKIVDELETWKERQKEMFNFELKKKEERHLHILAEEWQKRKENLEVKLANSVEQCKSLALSLNNATEDLKSRRLKNLEKEAKLIQANEELKWRYESKLQEVREIYCALKDDLTAKISTLEDKNTMLEAKIEPLLTENDELKRTIMKQNEKLVLLEKDLLDQDETSSLHQELKLLKEKLHSTQNSKIFFKEQWAKAVREIHRITTEYQQVMEFQIKSSKEELENLDLEEMLSTDTTALATDRILLDQIQKEVDIMKPSLNLQWKEDENIFNIPDEYDSSVSRGKQQVESSTEHEKKLKKLMEERDTLLKTGSYNIDDSIIVNLNSEIRSLLLNN
ncbi:centrosomal protein of 120 kDa-like isoform X1 [Prorops nasuta]|uniref:centrosomal protein of 120 kDa-like isoform X1 n=1 Tax=Prorops nasuta TaxID=863751 RepID=UPI0034CF987A